MAEIYYSPSGSRRGVTTYVRCKFISRRSSNLLEMRLVYVSPCVAIDVTSSDFSQGVPVSGNEKNTEKWSSKDRFGVVLETAQLNESELAEYCRHNGLFAKQIAA